MFNIGEKWKDGENTIFEIVEKHDNLQDYPIKAISEYGTISWFAKDGSFYAHKDSYNIFDLKEKVKTESARGDGGSTSYYNLPEGATELRHLIKHKKMEHGIGEAFCALYRLNDNGEYLRNLNKVKNYIEAEIEWAENNE